jgi:DNA-binding FrmR family transcriptional regulator
MPHSPDDKKRAITRLRRIRGQAEALERSIAEGAECGPVLQQLAAMRGAVNGLMADVLEGHLYESFGHADCDGSDAPESEHARVHAAIDETVSIVKTYLK